MQKKNINWAVYADHLLLVEFYLELGVSKIILETSEFSLLNRLSHRNLDLLSLEKMIRSIEKKSSTIEIVFNMDRLFHNQDFYHLNKVFDFLSQTSCRKIRLQDYGLAYWILKNYPEFKIEFFHFTSNKTQKALLYLEEIFPNLQEHCFSSEMEYDVIQSFQKKTRLKNEILIHGPLLIFYSKRMLLKNMKNADLFKEKETYYESFLKEKKRDKLFFSFFNNRHGSFLFFYHLFSLIDHLDLLKKLNLAYWLIDLRGQSFSLIEKLIRIYENLFHEKNIKDKEKAKKEIESLYQQSLTDGFFIKDQTDQSDPKDGKLSLKEDKNYQEIGQILGIVKEDKMLLKIFKSIQRKSDLFVDSRKKIIPFSIYFLKNLQGESVQEIIYKENSEEEEFAIVNAPKGVFFKDFVYEKKSIS